MRSNPRNLTGKTTRSTRHDGAPLGTRLVVQVPAKGPDYVPNCGPPMEPIGLLPPHDTTAYIIERILLPPDGIAADGKPRPKRMTYIVGWTDLPAAALLVPAMRILDYVSPRVLEDWEMNMEEELDNERARQREEKDRPQEQQNAGPEKLPRTGKVGRPRKHSEIESAMLAELDTDDNAGRLKGGAMAQTTPKKVRQKQFVDLVDLSEREESPSRQLEREFFGEATDSGEMEIDETEPTSEIYESEEGDETLRPQDPMMVRSTPQKAAAPSWLQSGTSAWTHESMQVVIPDSDTGDSDDKIVLVSVNSDSDEPAPSAKRRKISDSPSGESSTRSIPANITTEAPNSAITATATLSRTETNKTGAKNHKKKAKKPVQNSTPLRTVTDADAEEPAWEVKRIEDYELYDVEGRGVVRYFKVLWEGNWPADQNPSWEPEDNLPKALVTNYFKASKARREQIRRSSVQQQQRSSGSPKTAASKAPAAQKKRKKIKQTMLSWGAARFDSVSEAFAGGDDDDDLLADFADDVGEPSGSGGMGQDMDDEEDEPFIVDETSSSKHNATTNGAWFGNAAGTGSYGVQRQFGFT